MLRASSIYLRCRVPTAARRQLSVSSFGELASLLPTEKKPEGDRNGSKKELIGSKNKKLTKASSGSRLSDILKSKTPNEESSVIGPTGTFASNYMKTVEENTKRPNLNRSGLSQSRTHGEAVQSGRSSIGSRPVTNRFSLDIADAPVGNRAPGSTRGKNFSDALQESLSVRDSARMANRRSQNSYTDADGSSVAPRGDGIRNGQPYQQRYRPRTGDNNERANVPMRGQQPAGGGGGMFAAEDQLTDARAIRADVLDSISGSLSSAEPTGNPAAVAADEYKEWIIDDQK
jgi:hypothetical protein